MTIQQLEPLMVTVRQAAKMVNCSEDFIREEIKRGKLKARNLAERKTMIQVSVLKAWAEGRSGKA
jgi:excisionase family DNA binding protein